MRTYQAMIFDCGGVIFHCSFDNAFKHWAAVTRRDVDEIKSKFDFDDRFQEFERGEISSGLFRQITMDKLELKMSDEEFDAGWNSIYIELVPGIEQLLHVLTSMYRIVALTNTNAIHAHMWRILCSSVLKHFEKVFSSHEIGARKPEKKAYETVLNYLGLNPQNTIFFDDNPEFVQAAAAMNITSIQVTSFKQMTDEMRKHGIRLRHAV